jgi:uncharacterized protein
VQYNFEWDPKKAELNVNKHKVSFKRAAQVFMDPYAISIFDIDHSSNEERWITIGMDAYNVVIIVIHTYQKIDDEEFFIRIISARKATNKEITQYKSDKL